MLVTISRMIGAPVMSLQTGRKLATIGQPIINPHDLAIVAFYVTGPRLDHNPAVLFSSDIRELGSLGVIVDSADNIMSPDGLVRLEKILDYKFSLDKLSVIDERKRKLGTVDGYVLDSDTFMIQQLYVRPTLTKRLSITHLTINRSQIIEIDNEKVVVKSPTEEATAENKPVTSLNEVPFENPFRTGQATPNN